MTVPNIEFQLDTSGEQLNGLGKSVIGNECQFRSTCGDQFVYQIERGASLYVALTFDFTSEFHKETFQKTSGSSFGISISNLPKINSETPDEKKPEAYSSSKSYSVGDIVSHEGSLWKCIKECSNQTPAPDSSYWKKTEEEKPAEKIPNLASVEGNWEKFYDSLSEETKRNTRITIRAIQLGGNAVGLSNIFGDGTTALSCSLGNEKEINPCRETISRIVQYASTKEFAEGIETKPAILKNYRYRSYEEAGIFPGLISELTDNIRNARKRLAQVFENKPEIKSTLGSNWTNLKQCSVKLKKQN